MPGVTTRAKPSAKMAATTAPEAAAEPADYPDKPQHDPDVDPTPDLPPGNSVAAPVVAPAATAAAAAGLVGAATDDGATDLPTTPPTLLTTPPTPSTSRSQPTALRPTPSADARGGHRRRRRSSTATRRADDVRRPRRHRRRGRRRRSGPRCMMSPRSDAAAAARRSHEVRPTTIMTLTEHLGELRVAHHPLGAGHHPRGRSSIIAFYDHGARLPPPARTSTSASSTRRRLLRAVDANGTAPSLYIFGPLDGLATRLRIAMLRRADPRHAGGAVADLALHRAGAARQGEEATRSRSSPRRWRCSCSAGCSPTSPWSKALEFLISWSGSATCSATFQVSKYISLVGLMVAAFGIGFQFPVLLVFLQLVGVLTPQQLIKQWRYAIMVIFVVAAVITPSGDPISLLALAVPMTSSTSSRSCIGFVRPAPQAPQGRGAPEQTGRVLTDARPASRDRRRATRSRSTTSSSRPSTPSTPATTSSSPRRRAAARRSSPSTASRRCAAPGRRAFYTAPIKALSNQKFRDLARALRRRPGRPADRRQRHQRRRADRGDDDRGAAQHDLRRLGGRSTTSGWSCSTRCTSCRTPTAARCGRRSSSTCPSHVRLVCLSATVSNAGELAAWIQTVRGPTTAGRRAAPAGAPRRPLPGRRPHERPPALPADVRRRAAEPRGASASTPQRCADAGGRGERPARGSGRRVLYTPGRVETIDLLDQRSAAAGDLLHLQPQPVRRGGPGVPRRRAAPDHGRRARPASATIVDARLDGLDRRRPRRARLRAVPRPARGRRRRPPRRDGAGVQGGRRGVLRRGPDQGGVRHRDARRRHQHAGPDRGHREADQVHRRPPRDADGGGVHPAHRAGRAAGHRRRGPRRRAVEPVRAVRPGRRAGRRAGRSTSARRSARRTTWPPTWSAPTPASRPTTCSTCRSRSTRPTATSCASRPGWSACQAQLGDAREPAEQPVRRHLGVPPPRVDADPRAAATRPRRPGRRSAWPGCARARSSTSPKGRYGGRSPCVASAHRKGGMRLTTVTTAGRACCC